MRRRWLSRRAVLLHLCLAVWFPGCLLAFWWQVHRALAGNGLSYLYSVEWPVFALVGVWAWWQLVHIEPAARHPAHTLVSGGTEGSELPREPAGASVAGDAADPTAPVVPLRQRPAHDEELSAYNDRLARLATHGPKPWRSR